MAPQPRSRLFVGLMSGTSRDGIDAAILETDGVELLHPGDWLTLPYDSAFRDRLAEASAQARRDGLAVRDSLVALEAELTDRHAEAVEELLRRAGIDATAVAAVGFHGHTLIHRPETALSWQLGDPARLARRLGRPVVGAMRQADLEAGGQGAPVAPIYHAARLRQAHGAPERTAVLNLGGVANVTWVDRTLAGAAGLLAFDCGPGNALIDDWVSAETGASHDAGGGLADAGEVDREILARMMDHPFFEAEAPKSLDRDAFSREAVLGLSTADGAATLAAFTIEAVAAARAQFPAPVDAWYVTGGGRHNRHLMEGLAGRLDVPVAPVEALGWRGDALEAELMAYLAARHLAGLPATFPTTTGVKAPMPAGRLYAP